MQYYDVVIIGAGPAGLNCAYFLSKSGKSVLLLEKNKVIGPKVCAGGLTILSMEYLNLPKNLYDYRFYEATLNTPLQKTIISSEHKYLSTINRKNLGQWMLKRLKGTKIVIKTNTNVSKIEKGFVVLNNGEKIHFNYLVGADGSSSIVRQYLGVETVKAAVAIQYIIKTNKYSKLKFFWNSKLFKDGYAWIFPHKGYVSVGCGCGNSLKTIHLRENLENWMKDKNIDYSKGEFQAHLINADYRGFKFGNMFLAGDAAGLVPEFSGEGIHNALISGEEIAKIIIDEHYYPEKINKIIEEKHMQEKFLNLYTYSGPFRNTIFELLALILKNKFIVKKLTKSWGYNL